MKTTMKSNLFIAGVILLGITGDAIANDKAAELAAGFLAKAQAIDVKCKFLNSSEHDQISNLVARAEIALARRESVAKTKLVMSRSSEQGRTASCSDSERTEVTGILAAAQAAIEHTPIAPQVATVAAKSAAVNRVMFFAKSKKVPAVVKPRAVQVIAVRPVSGLKQYASLTERYYLARRCGGLSPRAITNFYQTIVSTHKQVLSGFGRRAVADVLRQSESHANSKSCA
jgi:hypothetical protein